MTNSNDQGWRPIWVYLDGVGWWPYGDLELDEYEQELEASIARGEWRSVPNLEEEIERARQIARNTMAGWSQEQLAAVERAAAEREAQGRNRHKSTPLAGDGASGDNSQQSDTY